MTEKISVPRGTFDILPEHSYKWQYVISTFKETAKLFNFQEIVTPIFENANLFERGVGEVTDIIEKEMYKFSDKKGRTFALRPEGTASVVRSVIENNLDKSGNPIKVYYQGPMFRYDRPQKGRYRQFYQYGVELIGSNNPYTDAEVIALANTFFKTLGVTNYTLEINSIGCETCSPIYDQELKRYYQKHKEELCNDCQRRLETNPKRLLDCKNNTCKTIGEKAPSILDYLDEDCKNSFQKVKQYLDILNVNYTVNPRIIRGLDYYTNTAFEFITTSLGAQNALLGGGRYNGLIKQLGGSDTPAVGFAGGIERLLAVMEAESLTFGPQQKPKVYVTNIGEDTIDYAVSIASQLRNNKVSVEFDVDKIGVKSQMKNADRLSVDLTIIVGAEEKEKDTVVVKDMKTGEQKERSRKELNTLF